MTHDWPYVFALLSLDRHGWPMSSDQWAYVLAANKADYRRWLSLWRTLTTDSEGFTLRWA